MGRCFFPVLLLVSALTLMFSCVGLQEGNLRPEGSAEVQEGNLRPEGSAEAGEGNLRPEGPAEAGEGNLRPEGPAEAGEGNLRPEGPAEAGEGNLRPAGPAEAVEGNLRPADVAEAGEEGIRSGLNETQDENPRLTVMDKSSPAEFQPETVYETRESSIYIMGRGVAEVEKLTVFLLENNPLADGSFVRTLMEHYIEEAAFEGVNHDIAFAQMCLETGFLRYGGLVMPEWNNFCGLGAIGPEQPGLVFPDLRTGVRAHIQHLKAYATADPLNGELVDPRFRYVRRGSSPTIEGLAGTWAADRMYAVKIDEILRRLYSFSL